MTTSDEVSDEQASDVPRAAARWWLAAIVLVALAARLAVWAPFHELPIRIADARDYDALATRLVEQGDYVDKHGQPLCLRPPLYPAFLAALYAVCGIGNVAAARAVQCVLGALTAAVVYGLGAEAFSRRVGLVAAGMFALFPAFLGFANLILSEPQFTLLLSATALLIIAAVRRSSYSLLIAAGVLLGLTALTRSVVYVFPPALAVYLAVCWNGSWMRRIAAAILPGLVFAAVIAPWSIRSSRHEQTLIAIDCMGGRNLMMGNYEYTPLERSWATISIVRGERAWDQVLMKRYGDEYRRSTQGQRDKLAMRYAKEFVLAHPALTAQRLAVKFFNFWQLERTLVAGALDGVFGPLPKWLIAIGAVAICSTYAVTLWAAIFGAVMAPPADRRLHLFFLLLIAFMCGLHTLAFAHSRYALPLFPILMCYAASAFVRRGEIWQRRATWPFGLAVALCAILVAGWAREFVAVDLEKLRPLLAVATLLS